jgi:membrane-associated phospholipid phosphatase
VNILGFIIYYTHPAAPPWYYAEFGNVLHTDVKSNAAGLLRFDHYFGITLFADLYSKGSNVFAAMPSLHSSYPLIGFIYASWLSGKYFMYIFGIVSAGIWFSAVYLYHHYTFDILAGISCALVGVTILEKIIFANATVKKMLSSFEKEITKVSLPGKAEA